MQYGDGELEKWWEGLSNTQQSEILTLMVEKMENSDFAESLFDQHEEGREFTPRQLAAIRKWDR